MGDVGTVVGIVGGIVTLVALAIAAGRWVGRRDGGEASLSNEAKRQREEARDVNRRTLAAVESLSADMDRKFDKLDERLRPIFEAHAQRHTVERDLAELRSDMREVISRLTDLEATGKTRRARARTRPGS